jgi:mannose-6-phosphate isomerase-like protein (cupin superfamily)
MKAVMDGISAKVLEELLGIEKELPTRSVSRSEKAAAADHWTRPILLERAAYLAKLAKYGEGSGSETIKEYPQHCVMLSFRSRDSEAEMDENFAHIFVVVDGNATLVCGGATDGEIRYQLRAGDVVHVPAGQPHQLLVRGEHRITCLVLKIQENA